MLATHLTLDRETDTLGRRVALQSTIFGVALRTVGIGLLPTYDVIGIAAPLCLVILRLIQGIAAGGEWTGVAACILAGLGRPAVALNVSCISARFSERRDEVVAALLRR